MRIANRLLGCIVVVPVVALTGCGQSSQDAPVAEDVGTGSGATLFTASGSSVVATSGATSQPRRTDAARLSLADYYAWIGTTLAMAIGEISANPPPTGGTTPQFRSAREALSMRAGFYRQLGQTFASVQPPVEAEAAHGEYVAAIDKNVRMLEAAAQRAPESAGPETVEKYEYANANVGYAFVAETNAKCALNRTFDRYGYEPYVFERWCEPAPRRGASIGTADKPINEIVLRHEVSPRRGHPNMWYDTTRVTATARQAITFTFDNRNPAPYLFNIAIYKGNPRSLEGRTPMAQTVAGAGPQTQKLTVDLKPGVYTYADNVHAYSMRGTLIVVP